MRIATNADFGSDHGKIKAKLSQLASAMIERCGKVSSAFRAFDIKTRGFVTFSDFAYMIDLMKLDFDRDLIMQIFTYMDTDQDGMLKYRDFCNLCAEQVMQAPSDSSVLGGKKSNTSEFSKIISQLKSKKAASMGRGGPNFVNKRAKPASNFPQSLTIEQVVGNQPYVSSELQRFMVNNQDLPIGHQVHSPQHNRVDSIREEQVYNTLSQGRPPSSANQWSTVTSSSGLSKLKLRL